MLLGCVIWCVSGAAAGSAAVASLLLLLLLLSGWLIRLLQLQQQSMWCL
jgi:hypothetical protein